MRPTPPLSSQSARPAGLRTSRDSSGADSTRISQGWQRTAVALGTGNPQSLVDERLWTPLELARTSQALHSDERRLDAEDASEKVPHTVVDVM